MHNTFKWEHVEEVLTKEQFMYVREIVKDLGMDEWTLIMLNKDKQPQIVSDLNDAVSIEYLMTILASMLIELREICDFQKSNGVLC